MTCNLSNLSRVRLKSKKPGFRLRKPPTLFLCLNCLHIHICRRWCLFRRGSRPVLLQNLIDMRKRLRSPAASGVASIVCMQVNGFAGDAFGLNLMCISFTPRTVTWRLRDAELKARLPAEQFSTVLLLYTNTIRKAKWANFGTTIEHSEGTVDNMEAKLYIESMDFSVYPPPNQPPSHIQTTQACISLHFTRQQMLSSSASK